MQEKSVFGYKIFGLGWSCENLSFRDVDSRDGEIIVYGFGMDFYKSLTECFKYYDFDNNNRAAEIVASHNIKTASEIVIEAISTPEIKIMEVGIPGRAIPEFLIREMEIKGWEIAETGMLEIIISETGTRLLIQPVLLIQRCQRLHYSINHPI